MVKARLAILVKRFPKLSETFIQGEIEGLLERGFDLSIISMYEPSDSVHQSSSVALLDRVKYLARVPSQPAYIHLLSLLSRRPGTGISLLRYLSSGGSISGLARLLHTCKVENIRHIHAHYMSEPAACAELVLELADISFSISAHAKDIYLSTDKVITRRAEKASFISTCTSHNVDHLKSLVTRPDKVQLVYHGIDTCNFRNKHCEKNEPHRIVAVGRFKRKKGFDLLIRACEILASKNIDFRCEIIGYGDEKAALQKQIEQSQLTSKVKLRSPIEHRQLISILNRSSVFVMPCRITGDGDRDGIPNSMLEAMACEVPVITTPISGIPEVVESGHNGILVPVEAPDELAAALFNLFQDKSARLRIARAGRQTVIEKFSWKHNIEPLAGLLEKILVTENAQTNGKIVYILKGFPRLSESFIAGEVRLLTQMGLYLELYSIKRGDTLASRDGLPSVNYCPAVESMSKIGLWPWLQSNLNPFLSSQKYLWRTHPLRQIRSLGFAINSGFKYRALEHKNFKKTFIKEFLLAGHIAADVLHKGGASHLHGHFCHDATTVTWMTSMLTGIPFSFTAHAKDIYQRKLNPGNLLERKLEATRFAVTCTQANVSYLKTRCSKPKKIHGIYHGLNIHSFQPAEELKPVSNRILSVGRHVEKKGFVYLLQACAILRDQGVDFRLEIIGEDGDQTATLKKVILDSGLSKHTSLLSAMTQDQLVERYQTATLFVLPCIILADGDRDGIPNVMAEAMACGLPVVVTGISGIPEIVKQDENGLIVPSRDAHRLAATIARALGDEKLRMRLGSQARERIESVFDAEHTHIELKKLFDKVLSNASSVHA